MDLNIFDDGINKASDSQLLIGNCCENCHYAKDEEQNGLLSCSFHSKMVEGDEICEDFQKKA